MSFQYAVPGVILTVVVLGGVLMADNAGVLASHVDIEQRRAEREAEREARRAEREARRAEREARRAERQNDSLPESDEAVSSCSCSARLSYDRPGLQFIGGTLSLIPRVNVSITSRGDLDDPPWAALLNYQGSAEFSSDDVAVPGPVAFSGIKQVAQGSCGDRYSFDGYQLSSIPLSGLIASLLGDGQELAGLVKLKTSIAGCGFDEEYRQFGFTMEEFGNMRIGGWRTVRE